MGRRRALVVVIALLAALLALTAWFARAPDIASAARDDDEETVETPRATPELATEALPTSPPDDGARLEAEPAPIEPAARPATMFVGRVIGPDGEAIVGARVRRGTGEELARARLDPTARFELGERELATPSDLEGQFVFVDVPANGEVLIVGPEHTDFLAEEPWRIARTDAECVLAMLANARTGLVVEAIDARTVEPIPNFVVDVTTLARDGVALRAPMRIYSRVGTARSRVEFLPGASVELSLSIPTMAIGRGPSTVRVVTPLEGEELRVRFELDPLLEPIQGESGIVTGLVVDSASGLPIVGATVTSANRSESDGAHDARGVSRAYAVSSARDGRFRVALSAEEMRLRVHADGHREWLRDVRSGDDVRVELERGAQLTVRLTKRSGGPAAPRWFTLARADEQGRFPESFSAARTNEDGWWRSADLDPGVWQVRVGPRPPPTPEHNGFAVGESRPGAAGIELPTSGETISRVVELKLGTPSEVVIEVDS
ncbi:MAG: carboxypeptidase regulatory-like domain-containing protein [Planctomycetes bacterium]|nr:carboxypeptidase regulatory-like domain-containing protein [Planctomycetota bacterium]